MEGRRVGGSESTGGLERARTRPGGLERVIRVIRVIRAVSGIGGGERQESDEVEGWTATWLYRFSFLCFKY